MGTADGYVVALDGGQEDAEGYSRYDGKEATEEGAAEAVLDVVGRATAKLSVVVFLVYLCQRGLDKGAAGSEEGDNPHPDDGTGAAEAYGRGHTHDVARAHTAREGHGESLERRDARCLLVLTAAAKKQLDHLAEAAHLHKARAEREIERCYQTQRHHRGTPYPITDSIHRRHKPIVNIFHSVSDLKVQKYKYFSTSQFICIFASEKNTIKKNKKTCSTLRKSAPICCFSPS